MSNKISLILESLNEAHKLKTGFEKGDTFHFDDRVLKVTAVEKNSSGRVFYRVYDSLTRTVDKVSQDYLEDKLSSGEATLNESSYDMIPYSVLCKIVEDNYDAVVSTNEYNWVQQGRFNVTSNVTLDVSELNTLIKDQGYMTYLRQLSETKSGQSLRYKFVRM